LLVVANEHRGHLRALPRFDWQTDASPTRRPRTRTAARTRPPNRPAARSSTRHPPATVSTGPTRHRISATHLRKPPPLTLRALMTNPG
jgi:hypothetical protein